MSLLGSSFMLCNSVIVSDHWHLFFFLLNSGLMLKKGQVGVWDFGKVQEKMVYGNIHSCIVKNMRLVILALSLSLSLSLSLYIYIYYIVHIKVRVLNTIWILTGSILQMMIQYMLHPQMEPLVALTWRPEFHYLWWISILMGGRWYFSPFSFWS